MGQQIGEAASCGSRDCGPPSVACRPWASFRAGRNRYARPSRRSGQVSWRICRLSRDAVPDSLATTNSVRLSARRSSCTCPSLTSSNVLSSVTTSRKSDAEAAGHGVRRCEPHCAGELLFHVGHHLAPFHANLLGRARLLLAKSRRPNLPSRASPSRPDRLNEIDPPRRHDDSLAPFEGEHRLRQRSDSPLPRSSPRLRTT